MNKKRADEVEYIPGSIETKSADHNNKLGLFSVHLLQFVNYSVLQVKTFQRPKRNRLSGHFEKHTPVLFHKTFLIHVVFTPTQNKK